MPMEKVDGGNNISYKFPKSAYKFKYKCDKCSKIVPRGCVVFTWSARTVSGKIRTGEVLWQFVECECGGLQKSLGG